MAAAAGPHPRQDGRSAGADQRPRAIALMGPTASGKTDLALALAAEWPLEIVSVDSALVYRGLDIGSAKPARETLARVPHWLVDVCDPHEAYSAARFAADADLAMRDIHGRGRVPLLVGGTGLYFRAVLDGLSEMPASDPALRTQLEHEAGQSGWERLRAELEAADPAAAARIAPADRQRTLRALEVWRATGTPISAWQGRARGGRGHRVLRLVLAPSSRATLHDRIAQRFDAMLAAGFLDEVRRLRRDPRLHPGLPSMRAVGYRQAWQYLDGAFDEAGFRSRAIAATRQLAKRQLTWLRGELAARWLEPGPDDRELRAAVARFLA